MYPIKPTLALLGLLAPLSLSVQVQAQVIPANDGTGTEVAPNGDITGGQTTGTNLFHSFQQFDVNAGKTANFVPNAGITNILGRVAGNAPSVINGTIQVTGNANLYLMNPAGLIFGQGAVLNVPGSFVGTTANAIGFGDGKWFNAVGTNAYATLVGNPSGFAFTTAQSGSIFNASDLSKSQIGGLTLVGGTVVSAGEIKIPGGNVNIVTVSDGKFVRINQTGNVLSLDLPFQDLSAGQKSAINATTLTPPSLPALLANRSVNEAAGVVVTNGVVKLIGLNKDIAVGDIATKGISTSRAMFENGAGGDIFLSAQTDIDTGAIDTSGRVFSGSSDISRLGGNIKLITQKGDITVDSIYSTAFGPGKGGNITVESAKLFRAVGFVKESVTGLIIKDQAGKDVTPPEGVSIYTAGNAPLGQAPLNGGKINITHRGSAFTPGGQTELINPENFSVVVTLNRIFSFTGSSSGSIGAIISRNFNGSYRVVLKDGGFVGSNSGITDGFKITQLPPITADKPVVVTPPVPPTDTRGGGGGTGTGTTTTGTGTTTGTTGTGTGTTGTGTTGTGTTGTGTGTTGTGTTGTGTTGTGGGNAADPQNQVPNKTKEFCDRQSSTTIAANSPTATRSASIDEAKQNQLDPCQAFITGDRILRIVE